jgi:(p)ppGpp synthase/HD superfamily hydrolase
MTPTASDALLLAEEAHRGQVDKAGKPYIEHPIAVANILAEQNAGHSAILAGLLHDVVEDSDITLDDLRLHGYPEEVVRAVDSVTKREGEAYMDMVRRAAADPIGRLVKLADNTHNGAPERLALLSEDEQAWFTQKYAKARAVLLGESS